jgi:WhiB family transcriptional regulator, redox-sensing transcriptional regulator
MIGDEVNEVDTDMAAQPPDYVKPEFVQGQAEPADRMTLDTALVPGRHGATFAEVASRNTRWIALAKCKTMKPALFFPHDGTGVRQAQQICAICPVKRACLAYALENGLNHGVWGGTSEREGRRMPH